MKYLRSWAGALSASAALFCPAYAADAVVKAVPAPTAESAWTSVFDIETRYISWEGTRGSPTGFTAGTPGRGSQFYSPFALQVAGQPNADVKVEFTARGGWVDARQSSAGGLTGSLQTTTDTTLSGTVTYLALPGVQPFFSLNTNLPTGSRVLGPTQIATRMDPDLVEVAGYGEGFNIGPTFGANVGLGENTLMTLSAGYTHRGQFDRDSVIGVGFPNSRMQPGDATSFNVQLTHQAGPWTLVGGATYVWNGATRLDGVFMTQPGALFALNGSAAYAWNARHRSTLAASWSTQQVNLTFDPTIPGNVLEPLNSNSDTARLAFDHGYQIDETWTLGGNASWFRRNANAYRPTDGAFTPAKTKWSVGGSLKAQVARNVSVTLKGERFWVHEHDKPDVVIPGFGAIPDTGIPRLNYTGWIIALGGTVAF